MAQVFLHKRYSFTKATLLAPFMKRYSHLKTLAELPPELVPMAVHSLLFADGKALFVKNSKAASTSLCHKIYAWEHGTAYTGRTVHRDQTLSQGLWAYPDIATALFDPECLKVTILRDPVKRCVSGFTDFVLDQKNSSFLKHKAHWDAMGMSDAADDSAKFDLYLDYIEACEKADVSRMDEHFRPQFYNLRPDMIDYGFIARVENLNEDIHALGVKLGLEAGEAPAAEARKNRSQSRFEPSEAQVARTKTLYAKDYAWMAQLFPDIYHPVTSEEASV